MSNADIGKMIKNKQWEAVQVAETDGPSVVGAIEPLLREVDPVVRLLAVDCLVAAGGPAVPDLLIRALHDSDEQVQINAINGLHRHLPKGRAKELLEIWDKHAGRETYVRQQIPMILGRLQDPALTPALSSRMRSDLRGEVTDGMVAGLARLGDQKARRTFGELLRDAQGPRVAEIMPLVRYQDDPWVIPLLRAVLDRKEIAIDLSSHRTRVLRRGCDLAVDEVILASKAKFSFEISPAAQYTDVQLREIVQFVESQKPAGPK
jgi:hypothetical protein